MNKTVNINLAGIIFHVDEPAYNALSQYLQSIRKRFGNEQGAEEILQDIEARIAELFQERTSDSKQVITQKDVDDVIAIMGKPEDYDEIADDEFDQGANTARNQSKKNSRRIYRDEDQAVVGGVCSGIGTYLGIDPVWLRLLFVLLVIGFGTGILLYIILWIVIPEAKTTAEKLEMRGEPVNIHNIEKSIKEEFEHLKERLDNLNAGESAAKASKKAGSIAEKIAHALIDFLKVIFGFLSKILGIALVFIGLILVVTFIGWLLGFGNVFINNDDDQIMIGYDMFELFQTLFISNLHFNISLLALIIIVLIPLFEIVYGGLRLIFRFEPINPIIRRTGGVLWSAGLIVAIISTVFIISDFEIKMPYSTTEEVISNDSTYYLHLSDDDVSQMLSRDRETFIDEMGEVIYLDNVSMNIKPSRNENNYIEIERFANGSEKLEARDRAENVRYSVEQTGNRLYFPAHVSFDTHNLLRNQEVRVTLYLKEGQQVYIDRGLIAIIYDIENMHNMYDSKMVDHYWQMTEDGLRCLDCPNIEDSKTPDQKQQDTLPEWGEDSDWPTT